MKNHRKLLMLFILFAALAMLAGPALAQDDGGVQSPEDGTPTAQPVVTNAPSGNQEPSETPDGPAAQDEQSQQAPAEGQEQAPADEGPFGGPWFFVIMIGGFILLYWIMGSSRRKQEAKRREMLSSLSKGDKIITIGGIVGTAVEVRDDEITVKVDDGTRMKFARWAIRQAGEDVKEEKKDGADKK